jgi:prepilin-type N-terminal cleavage/methylation domain-containing protein
MPRVSPANVALRSPRLCRGTFCADGFWRRCPPAEPGAIDARAASRRGMTLVELLVVLALLVVIGSIVVPVFTGSFASVRLRRAGDQVITRWSQARARAIETGEAYQFRFTPETGAYRVEPWNNLVEEGAGGSRAPSSGSAASVETSASDASSTTNDDSAAVQSRSLPEQITFHAGQLAVEDVVSRERQVASMQSVGDDLSTPVLFFPDGTTSEASVVLANDRNQFVRLSLRGLTGVGRATEILSREELQKADR